MSGVLIGELHGDPAPEGLANDGGVVDFEGDHQVSQRVGVGTERVVLAWLVRLAVAGKVGSDDRVGLRQGGHDPAPTGRAAGQAVHEQHHWPSARGIVARDAVDDVVPVEMHAKLLRAGHDPETTAIGPEPLVEGERHGKCPWREGRAFNIAFRWRVRDCERAGRGPPVVRALRSALCVGAISVGTRRIPLDLE